VVSSPRILIPFLTRAGGLSFFSPQYGLVCSNVISYEVVLASGTVTTASEIVNSDLWHALKGGSNNFGIVTSFTVRAFPSGNIWSGFLYLPSSQSSKVVAAFHDFVGRTDTYDKHTAGPIACFSYVQPLGIQVVSVTLVYTKPEKWPACWKSSGFTSLWRFWSTCKVQSLTSATDEMNSLNPPGRRQVLAATTIKNDLPTLVAAHAIYRDSIKALRGIKGLSWTLVMQPILPEWVKMGSPNPMGLDTDEALVNVSFTVNWEKDGDDEAVNKMTRKAVDEIEAVAARNGTGNRYRYLNYCAKWQKPFHGYGEENWRFLKDASRKYDPERLFQRGCVGGFKLEAEE
jgi:FAD/FMN-containing dehydrogenase